MVLVSWWSLKNSWFLGGPMSLRSACPKEDGLSVEERGSQPEAERRQQEGHPTAAENQ